MVNKGCVIVIISNGSVMNDEIAKGEKTRVLAGSILVVSFWLWLPAWVRGIALICLGPLLIGLVGPLNLVQFG